MARLTDHDIRDAEHALRTEITLIVARYTRRMAEMGKAHIQEAIEAAALNGETINGTQIGREAAARAAFPYFGGLADNVHTIEDSHTPPVLEQTHP